MDIKKSFKTLALCFCFIFTLSSIVPTYADSKNDPQLSSSNSIQSGNYIYFAAGEKLYKVNTKTQKSTCILTMSDSFYLFIESICILSSVFIVSTTLQSAVNISGNLKYL